MKILYAGDSPVGGPANYLLGILRLLKAKVRHLAPEEILEPAFVGPGLDAVILSDMSRKNVPAESEKRIARQVKRGMGLLMAGGWGSFSGPYGGWRGSRVETLLPVRCQGEDDRVNFPSGGLILEKERHPMFHSLSFDNPPTIAGLNEIIPRKGSLTLLAARKIKAKGNGEKGGPSVRLEKREYPLLVIGPDPDRRIAALTTDLAPHWSGGLLDWGTRHLKLPVSDTIPIEIGSLYVRFVSSLVLWLARKD